MSATATGTPEPVGPVAESNEEILKTGLEQAANAAVSQHIPGAGDLQIERPKKNKKKNKNFLNRGPTALLKNRGTGFEGRTSNWP
jgi:hypothetical protein